MKASGRVSYNCIGSENTERMNRGDKNRMVLWGQSAGANAVVTYAYANPDDPIVRGLIANSGSTPTSASVNTSSFSQMAASFGCGNLTSSDELTCMQKVDALSIQEYVRGNSKGGVGGARLGGYVADNVTVFANTTERLLKGRVAKVVGYACTSGIQSARADLSQASHNWSNQERGCGFCTLYTQPDCATHS